MPPLENQHPDPNPSISEALFGLRDALLKALPIPQLVKWINGRLTRHSWDHRP